MLASGVCNPFLFFLLPLHRVTNEQNVWLQVPWMTGSGAEPLTSCYQKVKNKLHRKTDRDWAMTSSMSLPTFSVTYNYLCNCGYKLTLMANGFPKNYSGIRTLTPYLTTYTNPKFVVIASLTLKNQDDLIAQSCWEKYARMGSSQTLGAHSKPKDTIATNDIKETKSKIMPKWFPK